MPNDFLLSPPVIYELWTSSFALIAFGKVLLYVLNQSIPAIVIGLPESIIALAPFSRILLSSSLVLKQWHGLLLRTPNLHEHCYLLRCWIAHCSLPSSSWTSCQLPEDKWTTQFLRPTHWEYLKARSCTVLWASGASANVTSMIFRIFKCFPKFDLLFLIWRLAVSLTIFSLRFWRAIDRFMVATGTGTFLKGGTHLHLQNLHLNHLPSF